VTTLFGRVSEEMECDSSETEVEDGLIIFAIGIIGAVFLGIVLAMIIIICSVIKNEKQIQKAAAVKSSLLLRLV
jgi:hypothetical protein